MASNGHGNGAAEAAAAPCAASACAAATACEAATPAGNFKPRCILLTGGAGFIGSHVAIRLVKRHPDVKVREERERERDAPPGIISRRRRPAPAAGARPREAPLSVGAAAPSPPALSPHPPNKNAQPPQIKTPPHHPPPSQVVVYDSLEYCASIKNLSAIKDAPNFKFVKGDVASADLVRFVLEAEGVDTVMHFAAQTHVDNSFGNSLAFTVS